LRYYFWKKTSFVVGFTLIYLVVLSFTIQAAEKKDQITKSPLIIGAISFQALIPDEGLGNTVICPLCTTGYTTGRILKGSEKNVETIFLNKLREFKEVQIIPQERVQNVYKRISSESLKKPLLDVLKKVGHELKADVLALGYIYRYTERVGYDYSVERPASVAFEIYMVNPSDSSIIWRGVFDKTQKSLMEDMFQVSSFFKGRGKWLTADELSKQGMDEIFTTFPDFIR
jgi:hypothetical protein